MLIIQKPKNKENYIKVNDALNRQLQEAGYQPTYKDEDGWYYLKTKEIKKFVRWKFFI
jgi:TfoX/Sxy family transcriptional regulator of competence genes